MTPRRALIVGAGGMGRAWGKNLKACERTDIACWVDVVPGRAGEAIDQLELSGVKTYLHIQEALDEVKPDFVVDVTVPEAHCEVTLASLSRGIPVLGEKPMASSMDEAKAMVAASDRSGALYMVSQSRRYHKQLWAYRDLIQNEIGGCGILKADFFIGAHFGGFRDEMPSPLVLDMAIHTFDAARFLSGQDPVSVYCEEFNPSWSWYSGDACANALFTMTNNVRFAYAGSWCSEGLHTSWESAWRAVGSDGTALWDGLTPPHAEAVVLPGGFHFEVEKRTCEINQAMKEGIDGSLADFLHALDTGSAPMGDCHDNIKSLAMVFGAIESARLGASVKISWT